MKIPDAFELPAFFQPLWTIPKAIKNSSCCTAACDCDALRRFWHLPGVSSKPQLRQPYTSPGSSPKHLHLRSHRTSVPCPSDVLRMRRYGWCENFNLRKMASANHLGGNSPFWFGVSKFQLDNKLSINQNSFSEVSSAVATKEDVSPLQARISLTSVQHPHIHIKSGSLLTSKSSNTPRRV